MKDGWDSFLDLCMMIKNRALLSELFSLMLTHEEKSSLETRYLIIQELLLKAQPQRKISETLNVSIAKITRGSNELKRISPQLKEFLERNLNT